MILITTALLILFLCFYNKFKTKSLPLFLAFYYLASAISGSYLYYNNIVERETLITSSSITYMIVALVLFIGPWIYFPKKYETDYNILKNKSITLKITYILIALNLLCIISSFNDVVTILSSGNIGALRANMGEIIETRNYSFLASFKPYITVTYFILISLFFHYQNKTKNKLFLILILVSSTSIIFLYLETAGRSGIIYWTLMFISNYLFYNSSSSNIISSKLRKYTSIILLCLLIPFILITVSRFGKGGSYEYTSNTYESMLDYLSQGFVNFNTLYNIDKNTTFWGGFNFPLFAGLFEKIGFIDFDLVSIRNSIAYSYPNHYFTFNTFIADIMIDFGKTGTLIWGVIYFEIVKLFISKKQKFNLLDIITIMYLFQLPLLGIFSSSWKTPQSNLILIFLLVLRVYNYNRTPAR